ncbi:MAG: UDP-glucose/GDP-mannose dehydrogenase family protein [Deltaproteobacteria bacterium]|nr:UDP-glucose/GDP-mannose dehydrogenase family protein [Deltaproteobacteria bacterium]
MKISVIGTGYVGLVVGTGFAETGHDVMCLDKDEAKISALNRGEVPLFEPGLADIMARNMREERLSFSTDLVRGVEFGDVIFIAVGTPQGEDGSADLSHVLDVARTIAKHMNGYKIIVTKSTVPVGTADKIADILSSSASHAFDVVSNPEFLKEGDAVNDFMKPDRIIIGTGNPRVRDILSDLYAPFIRTENPIIFMDVRSAEMTKYAANAMLATRISFMNDLANLCESAGADIHMVRKGMGADQRIGYSFLFPGVGYGGSCFPKDVRALLNTAREHDYELELLAAVDAVNERQKHRLVDKVKARFGKDLSNKRFAVWGLSFKPKTDDMREAPSVVIIKELLDLGAEVMAYDPAAMANAEKIFKDRVLLCKVGYHCLKDADGLLVVTEWNEFRRPDFERIKGLMRTPVVFDGRNVYDPAKMKALGMEYYGIGRKEAG